MLPAALNVFSMQGFLILNCTIGGQTLASVSSHLNDTLGIVIIGLISMAVSGPFLYYARINFRGVRGDVLRLPGHSLVCGNGLF